MAAHAARHLEVRHVDHGSDVGVERGKLYVASDSGDGEWRAVAPQQSFPNRISSGKVGTCQRLINHRYQRSGSRVLLPEAASAEQRDAHGLEIAFAHQGVVGIVEFVGWPALDTKADAPRVSQREIGYETGRLHAWQPTQAGDDFSFRNAAQLRLGIARIVELGAGNQNAIGIKA